MTAEDLAMMGIDTETVLYVISWGFSIPLFGWIMGYGVSLALTLIRKV